LDTSTSALQECGIDVTGALEKHELVRQIMRAEPHELGGQSGHSSPSPPRGGRADRRTRADAEH
jgi:hypothetical protein